MKQKIKRKETGDNISNVKELRIKGMTERGQTLISSYENINGTLPVVRTNRNLSDFTES